MADLDHIQWDNVTITEEDVLDPNPYLHLQNAWAALKAGRLRDVSQHLEYVQQTNNGDARVGKQYKELEDLLNPVKRLKKIYAAIDAGKIDDAIKDLTQLESSFCDDKGVQKECLKVHQEIGFAYLSEALKITFIGNEKRYASAMGKVEKAETECKENETFLGICYLVRKEVAVGYLNAAEKAISNKEFNIAKEYVFLAESSTKKMSLSQKILNTKRTLCEKIISNSKRDSKYSRLKWAELLESVVVNDSKLQDLYADEIDMLKKESAYDALRAADSFLGNTNVGFGHSCNDIAVRRDIEIATEIMEKMRHGEAQNFLVQQIEIRKDKLNMKLAADEKAKEKAKKEEEEKERAFQEKWKKAQRRNRFISFLGSILSIPIALLGAYIIKNRLNIIWPSILFLLVLIVICVLQNIDAAIFDYTYKDIFILPVHCLICDISLIITLYILEPSLSSVITLTILIIAYGIFMICYMNVHDLSLDDVVDVDYIKYVPIGCVGAFILELILDAFILPLILPFLSSFSSFFHTLF